MLTPKPFSKHIYKIIYPPIPDWPPKLFKPYRRVTPNLHNLHAYNHNTHFSIASQCLAQAVLQEKHTHHIASLATTPESIKEESLRKILNGPDDDR